MGGAIVVAAVQVTAEITSLQRTRTSHRLPGDKCNDRTKRGAEFRYTPSFAISSISQELSADGLIDAVVTIDENPTVFSNYIERFIWLLT
jgi:hypothetical protein